MLEVIDKVKTVRLIDVLRHCFYLMHFPACAGDQAGNALLQQSVLLQFLA